MKTNLPVLLLSLLFIISCKKSDPDPVPTKAVPTVTTSAVINITTTSATCGGFVVNENGSYVSSRGVGISLIPNDIFAMTYQTLSGFGPGAYNNTVTFLTSGKTYYVRAYAANTVGYGFGTEVSFTTP